MLWRRPPELLTAESEGCHSLTNIGRKRRIFKIDFRLTRTFTIRTVSHTSHHARMGEEVSDGAVQRGFIFGSRRSYDDECDGVEIAVLRSAVVCSRARRRFSGSPSMTGSLFAHRVTTHDVERPVFHSSSADFTPQTSAVHPLLLSQYPKKTNTADRRSNGQ